MRPSRPSHRARAVPWWGLVSAAAAPVLLVGGYMVAAAVVPGGFDSVSGTISALAARDAAHREVMTVALLGLGGCHLVTSLALHSARSLGRWTLALGGLATVGVATAPLPAGGGSSTVHGVTATAAFALLSVWPALARRRTRRRLPYNHGNVGRTTADAGLLAGSAPWVATVGLLGLVGWFAVELVADTGRVGLAERVVATAQALWPLAVVVSARRSVRG